MNPFRKLPSRKKAKRNITITYDPHRRNRKLNQESAAKILGINQPKISAIANGRLKDFSIERLIEFLNKLDQDVKIYIHEKPKNKKRPALFEVEAA